MVLIESPAGADEMAVISVVETAAEKSAVRGAADLVAGISRVETGRGRAGGPGESYGIGRGGRERRTGRGLRGRGVSAGGNGPRRHAVAVIGVGGYEPLVSGIRTKPGFACGRRIA